MISDDVPAGLTFGDVRHMTVMASRVVQDWQARYYDMQQLLATVIAAQPGGKLKLSPQDRLRNVSGTITREEKYDGTVVYSIGKEE